jgi:hypothetical protein
MRRKVMDVEHTPSFVSWRKSALTIFGGSLTDLLKSRRLDHECHCRGRSREAGHATKKDYRTNNRSYRPWQREPREV